MRATRRSSFRSVIVATLLSALGTLAAAASVLADGGGGGPYPK